MAKPKRELVEKTYSMAEAAVMLERNYRTIAGHYRLGHFSADEVVGRSPRFTKRTIEAFAVSGHLEMGRPSKALKRVRQRTG